MSSTAKIISSGLIATTLLLSAAPAGATDESLSGRAMTALGILIASQGNQALRDIRDEMKEHLLDDLKKLMLKPASGGPQQRAPAASR
jgi:hypothetical protein